MSSSLFQIPMSENPNGKQLIASTTNDRWILTQYHRGYHLCHPPRCSYQFFLHAPKDLFRKCPGLTTPLCLYITVGNDESTLQSICFRLFYRYAKNDKTLFVPPGYWPLPGCYGSHF